MRLRDEIVEWDNKYPWDLWWRNTFSVRYGSLEHRSMIFSHMIMQLAEQVEIRKLRDRPIKEHKEMFDNIDLNDFDGQ